ncbi:MAG: hypothetical protein JO293_09285 [Candidatus Eremiobacteraeota bacterium]|nr:hypothetical protein [Candidatus Eremiobacteraeota bacterium]MBV8282707.1 hypothetical protein [Candidatus Eremiobacteraeota bacterium]
MKVPNYVPIITVAIGLLTIASPFVNRIGGAQDVSLICAGAIMVVVGVVTLTVHARSGMNFWPVLSLLAGIWIVASTAFVTDALTVNWTNLVLGALAILTALVSLAHERIDQRNTMWTT